MTNKIVIFDNIIIIKTLSCIILMSKRGSHARAIRLIALKPHIIGLTGIVESATEVVLFEGGKPAISVDVMLRDRRGQIYVVEYKSNGDEKCKKKSRTPAIRSSKNTFKKRHKSNIYDC